MQDNLAQPSRAEDSSAVKPATERPLVSSEVDQDPDYWFSLRGESINQLIDAATPLIGMVLRVKQLTSLKEIQQIYHQVIDEIKMIEIELNEAKYEHAVIITYRYILCTFIDEIMMDPALGDENSWSHYSLLTRFHNENRGGEKVFVILARLESDPLRYRELLEFMFLCLSLGFKGRYKVTEGGHETLENIINNLHQILQRMNESNETSLIAPSQQVVATRYRMSRQWPTWSLFAVFLGGLLLTFSIYAVLLADKSSRVIEQLNQILK